MTDKIGEIVDAMIKHTRGLLSADGIEWAVACIGLKKIHDALIAEAPDHPALRQLRDFIAEQECLESER